MNNKGFTLVELLVGLILSMILAVAMLGMFKIIVIISSTNALNSEYEAKTQIAIISLQKLTKLAGLGSANAEDISITGNKIAWKYTTEFNTDDEGINFQCAGIVEEINDDKIKAEYYKHKFKYLHKENCDDLAELDNGTSQQLISLISKFEEPIINYTLESECSFIQESKNKELIALVNPSPAELLSETEQYEIRMCLYNIPNE